MRQLLESLETLSGRRLGNALSAKLKPLTKGTSDKEMNRMITCNCN